MKLKGKKIGILIESGFVEYEIFYYKHRFSEEGAEIRYLSRLWDQPSLTFTGSEWQVPFECHESFEGMDDATLRSFDAIIVPGGTVADRLRYTEDVAELPPATTFMKRAFAEPTVLKAINCHGMWLLSLAPELVRDRPIICHVNLLGDVRNMGAIYTDQDTVVDGDLVTGRSASHCGPFARAIIDELAE